MAQTAATVAPKLQQASAAVRSRAAEIQQKDLVSSAAAKTAQGWQVMTSFMSDVLNGAGEQSRGAGESGGGDFRDALQGLSGSSNRKYEGMSSEAFTGFGDDSAPTRSSAESRTSASASSNARAPARSTLSAAMSYDNDGGTPDDGVAAARVKADGDEWGWGNDDAPAPPRAKPARALSSGSPAPSIAAAAAAASVPARKSSSPAVPVSAVSPRSPTAGALPLRKSSSGSVSAGFNDETAAVESGVRGMSLSSGQSSSTAARGKVSVLSQIEDSSASAAPDSKRDELDDALDSW